MNAIKPDLAMCLSQSCRILAATGHDNMTLGHVTAREPGQPYLYMNAHDRGLGEIKAKHVLLLDLEGNVLEGNGRRHSEYPIHTEIYKVCPHINCVIHTHPFYSIIVGTTDTGIRPISHEASIFNGIPVFDETSLLIRTPELGQAVARSLQRHRAVLLRNHGVVVVGESIEEATVYAVLLERAAKMQVMAAGLGRVHESSHHEVEGKQGQVYYPKNIQGFWEFLVRNLPDDC
jgi:L-fuculose-phosphate aldolase